MSYLISDIENISPEDFPFYFFDCNVWILQLEGASTDRQKYCDFFEAVVNLNNTTDPKLSKRIKNKPKIIVTALLLSEIFNTYMRKVAMKVFYATDYYKKNGIQPSNEELNKYLSVIKFKDYRTHPDYSLKLSKLKSDFIAYSDYIIFRDDQFNLLEPITLIDSINQQADFNDFFYYYSLLENDIPIVTDDGDFIFQDIRIITCNNKLLKLK